MTEIPIPTPEDARLTAGGPLDGDPAGIGARGELDMLCRSLADIVRVAPRTPSRVSLRLGGASVEAEWSAEPVAAAPGQPAHTSNGSNGTETNGADPNGAEPEGCTLTAPLVGTFYRAPEPDARPFVDVGDLVRVGDQVAIVEAMKLMNPVLADHAGRVQRILVEDGQPVEYGQPLFALDPTVTDNGA
jgi:acetyl-CoA carboxylase biotin carboxyl carrier protein